MGEPIRTGLTPAEGRRFGLTVGAAFLVLAGILAWRDRETVALSLAPLGSALALGGLLLPSRMGPIQTAWMALAHALSRVTTPILLAIIYFLVIGPIGLYLRVRGKNPLRRRPTEGSYWVTRADDARRSDLKRQF